MGVLRPAWSCLLAFVLAAVVVLSLGRPAGSGAAPASDGPLSPVANGSSTTWAKTGANSLWEAVREPACTAADTSNAYTSTPDAPFTVRLAPSGEHVGKRISRIEVVLCYKAGSQTGALFAPIIRVDGAQQVGQAETATATACTELAQTIDLQVPVVRSAATKIEVGALKLPDTGTAWTVRICSIRATIYYEDDAPPAPPLPKVSISAAGAIPATPSGMCSLITRLAGPSTGPALSLPPASLTPAFWVRPLPMPASPCPTRRPPGPVTSPRDRL